MGGWSLKLRFLRLVFNVIIPSSNVSGVTMQCSLYVALKPYIVSLGYVAR